MTRVYNELYCRLEFTTDVEVAIARLRFEHPEWDLDMAIGPGNWDECQESTFVSLMATNDIDVLQRGLCFLLGRWGVRCLAYTQVEGTNEYQLGLYLEVVPDEDEVRMLSESLRFGGWQSVEPGTKMPPLSAYQKVDRHG